MSKKKLKKLLYELDEYNADTHYKSREDIIVEQLSKKVRAYYDSLTPERKSLFLRYLIREEDKLRDIGLELRDNNDSDYVPLKRCKNIHEVIDDMNNRHKKKKKKQKKHKGLLKRDDGLYALLYDHTMLSKKKYREFLANLAKKENECNPVLDCTLKSFKDELLNNTEVNSAVTNAFYAKYNV